MNLNSVKIQIKKVPFPSGPDYGKSEFDAPAAPPPAHNLPVFLLIVFFVFIAFLGDLWPVKNVEEQVYGFIHHGNIQALSMDFELVPSMRYSFGSAAQYYNSLLFVSLVKLFYFFIPYRLLCLRVISILSTSIGVFFIYRLAAELFCRAIGLLAIFLLVTSPVYVENFRAFGYIPLTNMIVCIICYFLVSSLNGKRAIIKTSLIALFSYITLSLYVIGRLMIILPVVIFSLFFKRYWRQLAVFVGVLIALVLIIDNIIEDAGFNFKQSILLNSEWLKPERIECPIDSEVLWDRFVINLKWAVRYLALKRTPFYDQEEDRWLKPQAMINPVYAPFLIIGLLVCLIRRRVSNIILLGWFFLLFIVPLASSWIPTRRFILALPPLYLLIAVGLWWVYNLISGFSTSGNKKWLAILALVIIFIIVVYNVYAYFSSAAKPQYNYSRTQCKQLAEYISKKGDEVNAIRYNRAAESLLWGNPYFDRPIIDKELVRKIEFDKVLEYPSRKIRPIKILDQIKYARQEGGNILYIHAIERLESYVVGSTLPGKGEDRSWRYSDIECVNENMRGEVELEQLPGIDEVYFLYVK